MRVVGVPHTKRPTIPNARDEPHRVSECIDAKHYPWPVASLCRSDSSARKHDTARTCMYLVTSPITRMEGRKGLYNILPRFGYPERRSFACSLGTYLRRYVKDYGTVLITPEEKTVNIRIFLAAACVQRHQDRNIRLPPDFFLRWRYEMLAVLTASGCIRM